MTDADSPQAKPHWRRALLAFFIIFVAIPALSVVDGLLKGYNQIRDQGWRYFVPTWGSISDLWGLAALLAILFGPILIAPNVAKEASVAVIIGWAVVSLPFLLIPPMLIERMEDRTGRKKIFAFAEVDNRD